MKRAISRLQTWFLGRKIRPAANPAQTVQPHSHPVRRLDARSNHDDSTQIARNRPEILNLVKDPNDLPHYDSIISGDHKDAVIRVSNDESKLVVVVADARLAKILASENLYGDLAKLRIIPNIRSQLEIKSYRVDDGITWVAHDFFEKVATLKRAGSVHSEGSLIGRAGSANESRFLQWLEKALDLRASDLHVEVDGSVARIRVRVDGIMRTLQIELAQEARHAVASVMNKVDTGTNTASNFNSKEFSEGIITLDVGRHRVKCRCEVIPSDGGFNFIARLQPSGLSKPIYSFDRSGMEEWHVKKIMTAMIGGEGLIILAGIPGSAKTTTIHTCIRAIENPDEVKIATIEAPIEAKLPGVMQTLIQPDETNPEKSAKEFNKAIQALVRANPDYLNLGEIKSAASADAAFQMGDTGVLTFATVHSKSVFGVYGRLSGLGVDTYRLTAPGNIALIVYQALVPKLCECKLSLDKVSADVRAEINRFGERFSVDVSGVCMPARNGACKCCGGTGFFDRTIVCEMMSPDMLINQDVAKNNMYEAEEHWHRKSDGEMSSMNFEGKPIFYHAVSKVLRGIIGFESLHRFASGDAMSFPLPQRKIAEVRNLHTK